MSLKKNRDIIKNLNNYNITFEIIRGSEVNCIVNLIDNHILDINIIDGNRSFNFHYYEIVNGVKFKKIYNDNVSKYNYRDPHMTIEFNV